MERVVSSMSDTTPRRIPRGARLSDAEHLDRGMFHLAHHLGDDGGRPGGADVQPGDEAVGVHGSLTITWSL